MQIKFHFIKNLFTFVPFINIMIVITKAGGNRPDESLATSILGKVLHSISNIYLEKDNRRNNLLFLITY
jgi:hypothetical protein